MHDELVVGHVGVVRVDDPVAIPPRTGLDAVTFVAVSLGKANEIEPVPPPTSRRTAHWPAVDRATGPRRRALRHRRRMSRPLLASAASRSGRRSRGERQRGSIGAMWLRAEIESIDVVVHQASLTIAQDEPMADRPTVRAPVAHCRQLGTAGRCRPTATMTDPPTSLCVRVVQRRFWVIGERTTPIHPRMIQTMTSGHRANSPSPFQSAWGHFVCRTRSDMRLSPVLEPGRARLMEIISIGLVTRLEMNPPQRDASGESSAALMSLNRCSRTRLDWSCCRGGLRRPIQPICCTGRTCPDARVRCA